MDEPIQMVAKIVRWAKKGGKIKRMGKASNNSKNKRVTVAKLLVEQAMSFGFYNGKRLARKK